MHFAYIGPHGVFEQPPAETKLWRYVSLAKFSDMLATRSLHFSRGDAVNDPFEGSWARSNTPMLLARNDGTLYGDRASQLAYRRQSIAMNCWYAGEHESAAMWLLYATDGIAIQTTMGRLRSSFPKVEEGDAAKTNAVFLGLVRYVDYETEAMPADNFLWPFVHKRRSFAHEQELRALIWAPGVQNGSLTFLETGVPPEGLNVPVKLETLIEKVYVAPSSPKWFARTVAAVAERFGCQAPVEQSTLDATPFF